MEKPLLQPFLAIAHQVLHQPSVPHHGSQQRPLAFHPGAAAFVAARGAGAGRCRGQYRGNRGKGGKFIRLGWIFEWMCHYMFFLDVLGFSWTCWGCCRFRRFFWDFIGILLDFWDVHSEIWPLCGWEFEILPGILWGIVGDLVYDGNKAVQSPWEPRNHHKVIGHCGVSMRKSWRVVKSSPSWWIPQVVEGKRGNRDDSGKKRCKHIRLENMDNLGKRSSNLYGTMLWAENVGIFAKRKHLQHLRFDMF